jgi:hypothetical protein
MNRRESLKALMLASGSLVALPAWADGWTAETVSVHRSAFSVGSQELIAAVADTIIPAGNSIGALSVGVDKFLLKLFDNCYDKDVQQNVNTQLAALDAAAQTQYGKPFPQCEPLQREALFTRLASSEVKEEKDFFTLMKSETIRGFSTSREVMMNYLKYKPVPGHYYGCVDVKA